MREHAIESAIKLASNENPYDPLPAVRAALAEAAGAVNRYPDHRATAVREALADRLGLPPAHVAVGCGSVGLLQQLLLAYADPGDEVLYAWRSFEAYPIYTAIAGATEVTTPLRFHGLDLPTVTKAVTDRTRVVLVTSPNNPTGTAVGHDELVDLLDAGSARARRPRRGLLRVRRACTYPGPRSSCPGTRTSRCCGRSRRRTAWPACASATCSPTRTWSPRSTRRSSRSP